MTIEEITYLEDLLNTLTTAQFSNKDDFLKSIHSNEKLSNQLRRDLIEIVSLDVNPNKSKEINQIQLELTSSYKRYGKYLSQRSLFLSPKKSFNKQRACIIDFLSKWIHVCFELDISSYNLIKAFEFYPETYEVAAMLRSNHRWDDFPLRQMTTNSMSKQEFIKLRFLPIVLQNLFDSAYSTGRASVSFLEDHFWRDKFLFITRSTFYYPGFSTNSDGDVAYVYDVNFHTLGDIRHELREIVSHQEISSERQTAVNKILKELELYGTASRAIEMNPNITYSKGREQMMDFLLTFAYVIQQFDDDLFVESSFDEDNFTLVITLDEASDLS